MKQFVTARRPGLSLIELLFALAILSSSILVLIGIFPTIFSEIRQGKNILLGTQIAQMKMEEAISLGFDANATSSGDISKDTQVNGVTSRATFVFARTQTPPSPIPSSVKVKKITVTVYEAASPLKYTKLETKIYKAP